MKKSLIVLGAAAMVAAAAVPALAFENEFHGMFRTYGYMTNAYSAQPATAASTLPGVAGTAGPGVFLSKDNHTASYFEQRARIQYIAKASDDLKLVTHFELDSLFGGGSATKYQGNDGGGLDADQVTLETKNVYLDFNVAPVNVKIGIQPFNDAFQGVFGNFDGSGILATGKFGIVTPSLGWFRVGEETGSTATRFYPGNNSNDLLVFNAKAAVSKDLTVGASYYYLAKDTNAFSATAPSAQQVHTLGVDAAAKFGPAAVSAFGAYQMGEYSDKRDLAAAYALGTVAKVKVGPGNVNFSALYLSGDKNTSATSGNDFGGWQQLAPTGAVSYFSASNMMLLVRNGASINTSSALGGTDLTKGGRGFFGAFAGFDGAMGKTFYATNVGYGQVAKVRGTEDATIGYELNATVGYKLYDSLAVSLNGAYALLGDGMTKAALLPGGALDAKDPYVTAVRVDYTF
jgi:hypothetical protein